MNKATEYCDVYDIERSKTGKIVSRGEKLNDNEFFRGTQVWVINSKNELFLQRRAFVKKTFPGKWSVNGGMVDAEESSIEASYRETKEEIGIDIDINKLKLIWEIKKADDWNALNDVWLLEQDFEISDLTYQKTEVVDAKWVSFEELDNMIKKNEIAENIIEAYAKLKEYLYV